MQFAKAVSVLIINSERKVLAVSRVEKDKERKKIIKNGDVIPIDKWGLPGGKMDNTDATIYDAASRELKEETGLNSIGLYPVYTGLSTLKKFMVTTFMCSKIYGKIKRQHMEGNVDWKNIKDIINGPFGDYNKNLFESLRLI